MAKKTEGGFFTKLLIVSAILLGSVLLYSYIIGNSIQPQLGVVEKIYMGIFSSADTLSGENKEINVGFNFKSNITIKEENISIFEGQIDIKNAEFYSNSIGLKQRISAENIGLEADYHGKINNHEIQKLDIISEDENIYIYTSKGLNNFFKYVSGGKNIQYNELIKKITQVNEKGSYAHIDNSQPIQEALSSLKSDHLVNKLLTSLVTSNPGEYFEQEKLGNLLKQRLYNDDWIEYFFIENKNLSEEKKQFFLVNPKICKEISPFIENINISGSVLIENNINSYENCINIIKDTNPFIELISQIYKFGDIEKGNYDFVISQGTQIDMRFTYSNHILQRWNVYIQNPEKTLNISILGDKFGIKESQFNIDYNKEGLNILGNIVNGSGNINIEIDNKDKQVSGDIIFQKYLLLDMDIKGKGKTDKGNMRFIASGDYKTGKIDYSMTKEKELTNAINLIYADKTYKVDYISPKMNFNSLYTSGKFILGFAEKIEKKEIKKEVKYVYDQGEIKGHYRTQDFEGNLKGKILSENTFQLELEMIEKEQNLKIVLESKEISQSKIEYLAEGKMEEEVLFTLTAEKLSESNNTKVKAKVEIPNEELEIIFESELEKQELKNNYKGIQNYETIQIGLDQIIFIPNMHQILQFGGPELTFAGASLASAGGTMSYLSLQGNSREERNIKIKSDMDIINQAIARAVDEEDFNIKTLIDTVNTDNKDIGIRIGGDKIYPGDSYVIGSINYELLALDKSVIENENITYEIAILELGERKNYQILGYLEEVGSKQRVITVGNYIPRDFIRYDFTVIIPENITSDEKQTSIQIELKDKHDLIVGDITNLGRVLDIDGKVLFIENVINPDITKVYLLGNDSPTLFIYKDKSLEDSIVIEKK